MSTSGFPKMRGRGWGWILGGIFNQSGSGGPWTPADLDTLVWYDASDLSTITEALGKVSQFDDKSGNGQHMIQANGSEQPPTLLDTVNELNTITFNGGGISLRTAAPISAAGKAVVIIWKATSGSASGFILADSSINNQVIRWKTNTTNGSLSSYDGSNEITFSPATDRRLIPNLLAIKYDVNRELFINGVPSPSNPSGFNGTIRFDTIGELTGVSSDADGLFCEVVICNPSDRQITEGYLAWKWGGMDLITLVRFLPIDHPYRWDGSKFGLETLWQPSDALANDQEVNMAAWYDASDLSTITESLGKVSQWDDKSGNDHHALQSTATSQPETGLRTIGGLNVMAFDGVNDFFRALSVSINQPFTVYFVAKTTFSPAQRDYIFDGNLPEESRCLLALNRSGDVDFWAGGVDWADTGQVTPTDPFMVAAAFNTSNSEFSFNGTHSTGYSIGTQTLLNGIHIGGNAAGNGEFLEGDIAELIFVVGAPDTEARQFIEGYLAWKWMLEGDLPGGHRFEERPPTTADVGVEFGGFPFTFPFNLG